MKKILLLTALIISVTSCHKTELTDLNSNQTRPETASVQVIDGHLYFSDIQDLSTYLESKRTDETGTKSSNGNLSIPGFESLADIIQKNDTKTKDAGDTEEMTLEEFKIYEAEKLVVDPILNYVLDTTLTIEVEDKLYKITKAGTFAMKRGEDLEKLYDCIASFDTTYICSLNNGEYLEIDDEITFINTFGNNHLSNEYFEISESIDEDDEVIAELNPFIDIAEAEVTTKTITNDALSNNLHNGYNTTMYKWKNNSLWQKLLDALRGKTVDREVKFDDKHRVQVTVFDVNYAFYASSGIKVEMQQRKKFLGIKYWTSDKAQKFAVGFNYLYGKFTLKNPTSYSSIWPSNLKNFKSFTEWIDNKVYSEPKNFIYGMYQNVPYVKDWSDKVVGFIPEISFFGIKILNRESLNGLYELPAKTAFNFLKGQSKKVYDPWERIEKNLTNKDPRLLYLVWGKTDTHFTKDKSYMSGVKEYGPGKHKTVRFDTSYGFYLNSNGTILPMLISSFNIEQLDVFAAAYYKNTWKGIRFVD